MKKVLADVGALALSILLVAAAASTGAIFSTGDWYRSLERPFFTPPDWIFGPAWTLLYLLMAVGAWLVWRKRRERPVGLPLTVYVIHLVFNALWTVLFFGLHRIGSALVDIVLLDGLIALTLVLFWRVRMAAGLCFVPYLAWTSFATVLNFAFWRLNRG